jgi:ribosome-associated toxin RatA of RatAB toxin-antitoxin module
MPAQRQQIDIDASPERVMGVITDFAAYADFLPEMQSVDVLRHAPGEWEVRFTVRVIRELTYTLRLVQPSPERLEWTLVEGAFKSNDGGWALEPLDGGARTRATYEIDLQVGMFVPGNIVRSLTQRSLPETLGRFKAEAERRAAVALSGGVGEA